jgi:hypothetical protein
MLFSKPFIKCTVRKGGHSAMALLSCRTDTRIGRSRDNSGNRPRAFAESAVLQLNAQEIQGRQRLIDKAGEFSVISHHRPEAIIDICRQSQK